MASREGITIYLPKYFMAVRNCRNIFVLYRLEARLCCLVYYLHLSSVCVDGGESCTVPSYLLYRALIINGI